MPALAPPMTSRQAKRLYKKSAGAQWKYTASQLRAADRRVELDQRRQREEEKERKAKINKRKRDEKEERDREAKRRLLEEGKLTIEDTWGKVTASQPRLNNFFKRPPVVAQYIDQRADSDAECETDIASDCDESRVAEMSDELTPNRKAAIPSKRSSIQSHSRVALQNTEGQSTNLEPQLKMKSPASTCEQLGNSIQQIRTDKELSCQNTTIVSAHSNLPANINCDMPPVQLCDPHFEVAEDQSAENLADADSLSIPSNFFDPLSQSPVKSGRSVLSELSPSKLNVQAQEEAERISTLAKANLATTPSSAIRNSSEIIADELALICTQDLAEDDEISWDKENMDPLNSQQDINPQKCLQAAVTEDRSSPAATCTGDEDFEDSDALLDLDDAFRNDLDDFSDDSHLSPIARKPRSGYKANSRSISKDCQSVGKPSITMQLQPQIPTKPMMPPPLLCIGLPNKQKQPPRTATRPLTRAKSTSESFDSIDEHCLLDFVEQVESSMESSSRPAKKKKRTLPWEVNPLPPPSTQDYMLAMVEELEEY